MGAGITIVRQAMPGLRMVYGAVVLAACFSVSPTGRAEEATSSPKDIRARIDGAARLLDADKPDEASESLAAAIRGLEAMASAPRPPVGFKTLADRASAVRRRLEKAGADVSGLTIPGAAPRPLEPAAAAARAKPVVGKAAGVSFSREVAPILAKSCGGCHISGRKGDFQMASYEGLMRTGMVQRGAGQASRLVEVLLTGDMPRGGGKVSSEDVATLIAWIDAGAPCDAASPAIGIDVLARGGADLPPRPPAAAVKAVAIKPGEISFAADVAPLLQEHCLKCHGGDETEANLSMANLQSLLKGGRGGPAVVVGKGSDSLLVKKLLGADIDGQRMPLGRPPLADAQTATIKAWVDQGARLDMLTATTPLDTIVAAGRAEKLSDADLARVRSAAGEKLWRRAIPDEEPLVAPRAGVCVIGNLPEERLLELADVAEDVAAGVRREFGAEGPLLKGGVVVYAVKQAFDYSALWQNVAHAERPKGISGHAGVAGDVVYGAMLVSPSGEADDLRAAVAEVITAAAFAGRSAPPWFAAGAGRAIAGRIAPKSALVQRWRSEVAPAIARLGSTADFLGGHGDPAATAAAAGGLLGTLAPGNKLGLVAEALDAGLPFDEAFARVFHATPVQAAEKWASRAAR